MIKSVIEKEEKLMSVKTFRSSNKLYDLMMKIKVHYFFQAVAKMEIVLRYFPCLCVIMLYLWEFYGLEVRLLYTAFSELSIFGFQHFWISISMVFFIAATTFTLLKINGKF